VSGLANGLLKNPFLANAVASSSILKYNGSSFDFTFTSAEQTIIGGTVGGVLGSKFDSLLKLSFPKNMTISGVSTYGTTWTLNVLNPTHAGLDLGFGIITNSVTSVAVERD